MAGRPRVPEDKLAYALELVRDGYTVRAAAKKVGVSTTTMYNYGIKSGRKVLEW